MPYSVEQRVMFPPLQQPTIGTDTNTKRFKVPCLVADAFLRRVGCYSNNSKPYSPNAYLLSVPLSIEQSAYGYGYGTKSAAFIPLFSKKGGPGTFLLAFSTPPGASTTLPTHPLPSLSFDSPFTPPTSISRDNAKSEIPCSQLALEPSPTLQRRKASSKHDKQQNKQELAVYL